MPVPPISKESVRGAFFSERRTRRGGADAGFGFSIGIAPEISPARFSHHPRRAASVVENGRAGYRLGAPGDASRRAA
jgi:hypothetical protein